MTDGYKNFFQVTERGRFFLFRWLGRGWDYV